MPYTFGNILTRKRAIMLLILIVILLIVRFLAGTSYITVDTNGTGTNTYSFTRHSTAYKTPVTTTIKGGSHVTKRVPPGGYDVLVTQGTTSYLRVIKTSGFLRTTHVQAILQPEKARSFIGNNPSTCMNIVNGVLLSYVCDGTFDNALEHVPATAASPTYTNSPTIVGSPPKIEGIYQAPDGKSWALMSNPSNGNQHAFYSIDQINNDLSLGTTVALPDLSTDTSYSITPYQQGFLVYSKSFNQILYYPSPNATPQTIHVLTPNTSLTPSSLSVYGGTIAVAYTTTLDNSYGSPNQPLQTRVVVYKDQASKEYDFNKQYNTVELCGTDKLCAINTSLYVYDISGNSSKASEQFELDGVENIADYGNGLLAIRKDGILNVDINTQTASFAYTYGNYSYCGIAPAAQGFVLCVNDSQDNSEALLIDQGNSNSDNIDKKIAAIQNFPEVDTVSIYGQYITIATKGPTVLDPTTGEYGPDPTIQAGINSSVNQELKSIGLDTSKYTVNFISD